MIRVSTVSPAFTSLLDVRVLKRTGMVAIVLAMCLTACGGQSAEQRARSALAAQVRDAAPLIAARAVYRANPAAATCYSSRLLSVIGLPKLESYGVVTKAGGVTGKSLADAHLSIPDARAVAVALYDCAPEQGLRTITQRKILASLPIQVSGADRKCLADAISKEAVVELMASGLVGQGPTATRAITYYALQTAYPCIMARKHR